MIVDDDALLRSGFRLTLASARTPLDGAGDVLGGTGALDPSHGADSDAVLLDIRMPGRGAREVLSDIRDTVSRTLVDGRLGGTVSAAPHPLDVLTERERQVLDRLGTGASNAEIGRALHMSLGTVKDHVSAILQKLGVGSRIQAAIIAERARHGRT